MINREQISFGSIIPSDKPIKIFCSNFIYSCVFNDLLKFYIKQIYQKTAPFYTVDAIVQFRNFKATKLIWQWTYINKIDWQIALMLTFILHYFWKSMRNRAIEAKRPIHKNPKLERLPDKQRTFVAKVPLFAQSM